MEPNDHWIPLSLLFIEFPAGDLLGYILAWFSMVPVFISVGFITLIIIRRDLHTASYFGGILLNGAISVALKHIIKDKRPLPSPNQIHIGIYGMPSSHSQFMGFFNTYLILFLLFRLYRNYNWIDDSWKIVVSCLTCIVTLLVCISRVYLGYHFVSQVLCGALLGMALGAAWFCTVHLVLTPFFPVIAASLIGEFLMVRDSTLIPHVMWFEYKSSRSEARNRQRKVTGRKSQ
ncbi:dolichyldiphosphatase 1-like [Argonauta hians]